MCYYIGIEDLAANAMIEMLKSKDKEDFGHYTITLRELETYGAKVVRCLKDENGEEALLILSRASTSHMFRNYSDYFEEVEKDNETAISLKEGKTVEDLVIKFRTYIATDLIKAFMNEKAVSVLYGRG